MSSTLEFSCECKKYKVKVFDYYKRCLPWRLYLIFYLITKLSYYFFQHRKYFLFYKFQMCMCQKQKEDYFLFGSWDIHEVPKLGINFFLSKQEKWNLSLHNIYNLNRKSYLNPKVFLCLHLNSKVYLIKPKRSPVKINR